MKEREGVQDGERESKSEGEGGCAREGVQDRERESVSEGEGVQNGERESMNKGEAGCTRTPPFNCAFPSPSCTPSFSSLTLTLSLSCTPSLSFTHALPLSVVHLHSVKVDHCTSGNTRDILNLTCLKSGLGR